MFVRKPPKKLTYDQALFRAAQLCSKGEQCPSDIYAKVQEWGLSDSDAARLVGYLTQEKYLDEARYVHAFVNDRFNYQHWGRVKIAYALRMKGIEDSLIADTMEEVIAHEAYFEACLSLLRVKIRGMEQPLSQSDRAKIYRFSAQRGFESQVIGKALAALAVYNDD